MSQAPEIIDTLKDYKAIRAVEVELYNPNTYGLEIFNKPDEAPYNELLLPNENQSKFIKHLPYFKINNLDTDTRILYDTRTSTQKYIWFTYQGLQTKEPWLIMYLGEPENYTDVIFQCGYTQGNYNPTNSEMNGYTIDSTTFFTTLSESEIKESISLPLVFFSSKTEYVFNVIRGTKKNKEDKYFTLSPYAPHLGYEEFGGIADLLDHSKHPTQFYAIKSFIYNLSDEEERTAGSETTPEKDSCRIVFEKATLAQSRKLPTWKKYAIPDGGCGGYE